MRWLTLDGPRGIVLRCAVPERAPERLRGWLGRTVVDVMDALLIPDATSVHTIGMRFPILVVRLDRSLRVVDVRRVPPGRLVPRIRYARHVVECHPGLDLRVGDRLSIGRRR